MWGDDSPEKRAPRRRPLLCHFLPAFLPFVCFFSLDIRPAFNPFTHFRSFGVRLFHLPEPGLCYL